MGDGKAVLKIQVRGWIGNPGHGEENPIFKDLYWEKNAYPQEGFGIGSVSAARETSALNCTAVLGGQAWRTICAWRWFAAIICRVC